MRPDMVEDGVLHQEKRYVTDLITDHALTFLEELSAQAAPYYLGVHYTIWKIHAVGAGCPPDEMCIRDSCMKAYIICRW